MATTIPFTPAPGNPAAYGKVPKPIVAPDPFADVSALLPGLGGNLGQASANIGSGLRGELTPEQVSSILNENAAWGQMSGLGSLAPGSLGGNRGLKNLGLATGAVQDRALQNMLNLTHGTATDLTLNPAINADIQSHNNTLAAAADPYLVAEEQARIWAEQFNALHPTGATEGMGGAGVPGGVNSASVRSGPSFPASTYGPWSTGDQLYTGKTMLFDPSTSWEDRNRIYSGVTNPLYQNPNLNSSASPTGYYAGPSVSTNPATNPWDVGGTNAGPGNTSLLQYYAGSSPAAQGDFADYMAEAGIDVLQ